MILDPARVQQHERRVQDSPDVVEAGAQHAVARHQFREVTLQATEDLGGAVRAERGNALAPWSSETGGYFGPSWPSQSSLRFDFVARLIAMSCIVRHRIYGIVYYGLAPLARRLLISLTTCTPCATPSIT